MHDLVVQTLQTELAMGISACCMRLAAAKMFAVNSAIGLCCLGIERSSLQHFCQAMFQNSVFVSTARGLTHSSTSSGGSSASIPHYCYTCEGSWLWRRVGCFVDNSTMFVRCQRPLLLAGVPLTSRREVQALLLPAAAPTMLPLGTGGWACGTSLPISPAAAWMEEELQVTVDAMTASRHESVPCDFLELIVPALALKPDCVFPSNPEQVPKHEAINSSSPAAFACSMRLSDLVQGSAIELPQNSDACQLLCRLVLHCCRRCRPGQRLWHTPDFASLNSDSHHYITNPSVCWPVGCRAAAGAIIAVLVACRSARDAKYPRMPHTLQCSWSADDLRFISSYEANNFAPTSLDNTRIVEMIAALLQFCGHTISNWKPQAHVAFNEGLLLLQMMCCSCPLDLVMCAGTLHQLLEFTCMLLGRNASQPTLGGERHCFHDEKQPANSDENEESYKQFESALDCAVGICCNAIEVMHVRSSSLACRINIPQQHQDLNLVHACRLLEDIMSSPIKANAPLVSFAQQLHSLLSTARADHRVAPFFAACSHAFVFIAASANASRSTFGRSCLVASFVKLFLNAIDAIAPSLQGNICVCECVLLCPACFLFYTLMRHAEAAAHSLINQLSFALASGLANVISSSLTRVLQCRLEADAEMRNCLLKWVE